MNLGPVYSAGGRDSTTQMLPKFAVCTGLHEGPAKRDLGWLRSMALECEEQSPPCEAVPCSKHRGPMGARNPSFEIALPPGSCTPGLWWESQIWWTLNSLWDHFFLALGNSSWLLLRRLISTCIIKPLLGHTFSVSFSAIRLGWEFSKSLSYTSILLNNLSLSHFSLLMFYHKQSGGAKPHLRHFA